VSRLDFRVLGPVETLRNGRPVPVRGRTTIAVLTRLLLSTNEVVPMEALMGSVWGSEPPAHPRAALHNGVSRLRALCEGHIETLAWGYRLCGDPEHVDLLRFGELITAAQRAIGAGKAEHALAALDQAVALWREPLLGNVDSPALRHEAIPWLTERYLRAQEERAELCLLTGRENTVVEQLPRLIGLHPFRERMVSHLMVALVRGGRRADALAVYDSLRRALRRELGIDPDPAIQDLHVRILRAEESLEPMKPPTARWRVPVRG
jgi:DNA-binding SARP family transcriptional activator